MNGATLGTEVTKSAIWKGLANGFVTCVLIKKLASSLHACSGS